LIRNNHPEQDYRLVQGEFLQKAMVPFKAKNQR